MKKVVVCDLDGTLLDANHQIDEDSLAKVKDFCEQGGIFIVATGRLDHDIEYVEKKLGFSGVYRISQNGAVIKDHEGSTIHHCSIKKEIAREIGDFLHEQGLRVEVSDIANRYFPAPRPAGQVAEFVDSSKVMADLQNHIGDRIHPVIFLMFGDEERFKPIKEYMDTHYGAYVETTMTSPTSLEIFDKRVSKGSAIQFVAERLSIPMEHVYTIGDSDNDISMFQVTDHSFAMAHSKPHVREKAAYTIGCVGECFPFIKK